MFNYFIKLFIILIISYLFLFKNLNYYLHSTRANHLDKFHLRVCVIKYFFKLFQQVKVDCKQTNLLFKRYSNYDLRRCSLYFYQIKLLYCKVTNHLLLNLLKIFMKTNKAYLELVTRL
jgi:hypothetical protein